jgi:hypothetical protein
MAGCVRLAGVVALIPALWQRGADRPTLAANLLPRDRVGNGQALAVRFALKGEILMEATRAPVGSPFHRSPESWPRRSHLELGAYRTAAGSARGHAASVLREWVEPTEYVVSELVANSVLATEAVRWLIRPPIRLWLLSDGAGVLVHVWDAIVAAPEPREAGLDDESGRGLASVAALSAQWGHHCPPREPGGKVTWALITSA